MRMALSRSNQRHLTLASVVIVLVTLGLKVLAPGPSAAPDFDGLNPGAEVTIAIEKGETGLEIARKLRDAKITKSSEAFFRIAVSDQRSQRISVGQHRVQTNISAAMALEQLLDPKRIIDLVVIRDGAWQREVEAAMIQGGFDKTQVKKALSGARPPAQFRAKSIEGFLYPAFYSFEPSTSAEDAVASMIDRFNFSTADVNWKIRTGYTPYQVLIIASLIESEGTPDVHGKVAQVIYNRLERRMPLQFDSTVHYILGRRGEIRVSAKETQVNSPYNTFERYGLPPTPIGSPTRASIDAALNPEPGPWLYFVTVKPGETKFTDSYEVFLDFKAEYKKNLARGLFE